MKNKSILIVACLLTLFCRPARAQSAQNDTAGGYKLVWADEFNNEGPPDTANWQFEKGFVRNHELQWYQPQNAYCHNGLLIIEAKRVNIPNPDYVPQSTNWKTGRRYIQYTSASINTAHSHSWKYGRMVMRARIDTSAGLWPAFWTLGVTHPWPSKGEIDIMEYYRGKLLANIACGTAMPNTAKWYSIRTPIGAFKQPDWSQQFHTWRMDWDEESISLYVDGQLLNKVLLTDLVNRDGSNFNPFTQPQYILLNMAVGGDSGGDPSSTTFPRRFEVDYVRVYQR